MGRRRGLIIGWLLFGLAGCVAPTISEIAPGSAAVGDPVTLTGTGFGNTQGTSRVFFAGVEAGPASAWSNTGITVAVPAGATTGEVTVRVGSTASAPHAFIVSRTPLAAVRIATTPTPGDSVLNAYRAAVDEGVTSKGVLIEDFNGDGHLDYVGSGSDFICLHLGSGDGRFADPTCQVVLPSSGSMTDPSAADFNEDGVIDLAFTNFLSAGQAGLLLGQGGGVFATAAFFPLGEFPARSIAADLNGDGHLDLAARATSSATGSIRILFGDGAGSFAPYVSVTVARDPAAVGAADLNGDSLTDLVAISSNPGAGIGGVLSLLFNEGQGGFAPPVEIPTDASPSWLLLEDVDGDGHLDISVVHASPSLQNNLVVYRGNGAGSFSRDIEILFEDELWALASGDLNGDGVLDLIAGGAIYLHTLLGYGGGEFLRYDLADSVAPFSMATADFDEDDRLDLFALGSGGGGIFLGDGAGALGAATIVRVSSSVYDLSRNLVTGDFDDDGNLDIAVGERASPQTWMHILLGDGTGGFTGSNIQMAHSPQQVLSADFSGDGDEDLVSLAGTTLNVLVGGSGGTFGAPIVTTITRTILGFVAGDVDGDGDDDLILNTAGSPRQLLLLRSNGNGTFAAPVSISSGLIYGDLWMGYLDADQHIDFVFTAGPGGDANSVRVNLGDGTGGFTEVASLLTAPDRIRLGDLNGDGFLDVVTAANSLDDPVIMEAWLGDGLGQFAPPVASPYEGVLGGIGDFDGDGLADLTAHPGGFMTRLLHSDGAGGFTVGPDRFFSQADETGVAGDVNSDGKLDLIQIDSQFRSIWILFGGGQGEFVDLGVP